MEENFEVEVVRGAGPRLAMSSRRRLAVTAGVMIGMFLAALAATRGD